MDIVSIIINVGSIIAGLGILDLIKWFATRNETKRAAKLENDTKEAELEDIKQDNVIDGWEKLSTQYQKDIEYYRTMVTEKDNRIREYEELLLTKDELIGELRSEINNLTSENTALHLTRCQKLQCVDRIPPFGYKQLDIKNGVLLEDN